MKCNHTLIGFVGLVLFTVIIWMLIGWSAYGVYRYFRPCESQPITGKSYVAEPWVSERHKYRGISFSTYNPETGETYFVRDGRKCKL